MTALVPGAPPAMPMSRRSAPPPIIMPIT
jgi:hypothetical protein